MPTRIPNQVHSTRLATSLALVLALATPAAAARGSAARGDVELRRAGERYESGRLLPAAARLDALAQSDSLLGRAIQGGLSDDRRAAAQLLLGVLRREQGSFRAAADAFRGAEHTGASGPFADDAAFAGIEAMEAAGDDAEAAKQWPRWEKRYPTSPLVPCARLAFAWNALRRSDTGAADRALDDVDRTAPWLAQDPRARLARALAALLENRAADALALLGERPQQPAAAYVRALALRQQGALLKAAAGFQDVADRWPDSPLRDAARLAKADAFLAAHQDRSAAEEFARVAARADDEGVKAEAELRAAGAVLLIGAPDSALALFRGIVSRRRGTDVAARAQFLIGQTLADAGRYPEAIVELNQVLSHYFQHSVAASAQYRVARCLDAVGRSADATGSYQAVVSGYPLEPEAPAAAYLAGVGLLHQGRPRAAAPYFQIVLDRYAARRDSAGAVVFARPEHAEMVDAALCMLEVAWHRAGDLGQLAGAPHLLLQRMPPSRSPWRAWALLFDADALAAQGRFDDAQASLERIASEFRDHPAAASATQLLAWTYGQQGRDSLAVATEERLLARWAAVAPQAIVSAALLDIAHERFNQKRYLDAAAAYEDFLHRYPGHPQRLTALYQAGLCYLRLDRAGDAVDRWETIVRDSAASPLAERAWARAGDAYFQADRFDDATRSYRGLLEHFGSGPAAALASLRLGQCAYNAGHDAQALEAFGVTIQQYAGTPIAREAARGQELALYRLSQRPDGEAQLAKLVEQYPSSPFTADAMFQIARRAWQAKRWDEAAEGFRKVVSQFPGHSAAQQAQFLMADALANGGHADDARGAYEQFLSFFPESELAPSAAFRLGLLQFAARAYAQAGVAFLRALDDSAAADVRSAALYDLAICQRLTGDTASARAGLERHRAEFPTDARSADVACQLGDLDESASAWPAAAAEYQRGLDAHPAAALATELAFRLGRVREQQADVDGALRAYLLAANSTDRNQAFRLSAVARLAALYETRHQTTRAVAAYRDLMANSRDHELAAAAAGRVAQLEAGAHSR